MNIIAGKSVEIRKKFKINIQQILHFKTYSKSKVIYCHHCRFPGRHQIHLELKQN
jgi:hypothetical protein